MVYTFPSQLYCEDFHFPVLSCAFSMHRPPTRLIKFRNYMPKDDSLKEKKIPNTKPLSGKQVKHCTVTC